MNNSRNIYSVKQVNSYIKRMLDDDFILRNIYIQGEVSNCKYHSTGHIYFSLKDASGVIPAVMWKSDASSLKFRLEDGMQIIVHGSISVYEAGGRYQIYARSAEEAGKGDLAAQFEELKKKLEEMGYFSEEYKKEVPRFSLRIGVVTAETGAVIRDIYNVAKRRNPYCQILLYPAKVQGDGAAETIAKGISYLDKSDVDVIIIGRGGGSMEDLWAFNEEMVAQAIFQCNKPVISAVGHETDFTIADFVADLRAPTPSAAAELAVFDYALFEKELADYRYSLNLYANHKLDRIRDEIKRYRLTIETLSPQNQLLQKKQYLTDKSSRLEDLMEREVRDRKERLAVRSEHLLGLSPLKRLSEGYSFATDPSGNALKSIRQVKIDDNIRIRVTDGNIDAAVITVNEENYE
ncbi:MAG: exodeoxyribonuclease VII large subunit [Lachnospiraceae bacterium]|nr:exodeoxyribonuclease VII large subunit [Lachnospiraceae bacterium]